MIEGTKVYFTSDSKGGQTCRGEIFDKLLVYDALAEGIVNVYVMKHLDGTLEHISPMKLVSFVH